MSSIYESRLIFIYDENTEVICKQLKASFGINEEISSSIDSETGEIVQTEINCKDYNEEIEFIQESFVQHEIIWYRRPLQDFSRINSTNSITDSTDSAHSRSWKISSQSFESIQPFFMPDSPMKSVEVNSFIENSFDSEMQLFLKIIFEKLFTSLIVHESTLVSKIELNKAKSSISEAGSDTGSILSLDDGEFNLYDPLEPETKRFQDENRPTKGNRSRLYLGRFYKQTADQSLLCGNYFESYHYYQLAICYLKKVNDNLWLAGAEEGLCCSWIVSNFPTPSQSLDPQINNLLHEKSRQILSKFSKSDQSQSTFLNLNSSSSPTDQIDFSLFKKFTSNDLFKNPPEIHNLNDLDEKYHGCISRYKKALKSKLQNLYPIHLDSIIKASRFFIDQHRFLEASNFLKIMKTDLLSHIQSDLEQYHNTLAQLYSQMGFFRKSALHKYKMFMVIQSRISLKATNRQQINEHKMGILIEILNDLNVRTIDLFNDKNIDNIITLVNDKEGCQSIKCQMISELFHLAKSLNWPVNTILGLGLSILDNWNELLSQKDCERFVADLSSISKSGFIQNNMINRKAFVTNLPKLTKVILNKLPEYLLPKQQKNINDKASVFLYTPLKGASQYGRQLPLNPVIWVCGEECEIVLQFDNPIKIPLQLQDVSFLLLNIDNNTQTWIPSEGSSIHFLKINNKNIHCHFVVVPNSQNISTGNYRIINVSYQLTAISNISFQPHKFITDIVLQSSVISEIKLYPMMPQLRIIPSINEQIVLPDFKLCKMPSSTVCCSNLLLYDNEIFEFSLFFSNESKELDIDQIVCCLDELDFNIVSNTLISRFADQEFSNRKCSSHKMLSFSSTSLDKCLPIKSISSLMNSTKFDCENPTLPTEAIVKFRIDSTDQEFCQELFEKSSLNKYGQLDPLWRGQLRITIQYWSNCAISCDFSEELSLNSDIDDVVIVKQDNPSSLHTFRESVCVVNCQLMMGLGLINYQIDSQLNLVLTLMNFTDSKMNIEISWKDMKIQQNCIIASRFDKSNKYLDPKQYHRTSSTELYSHICNLTIPSDKLLLKSVMTDGLINSDFDLVRYIQSNLKIIWAMKDKNLDKLRQGCVNLTWCNCYFSQDLEQNPICDEFSISHQLSFSINDLMRIWMWNNVKLEMIFSSTNNDNSPTLPDNFGETIHLFDGIVYRIVCKFKEQWPSFFSEENINNIKLLPCVVPTKICTQSLSSSDCDNTKMQRFVFAGNTGLFLQKESLPITEMSGFIMFLLPGNYNISCQLIVTNTGCHFWQSDVLVLVESYKYEVHIV